MAICDCVVIILVLKVVAAIDLVGCCIADKWFGFIGTFFAWFVSFDVLFYWCLVCGWIFMLSCCYCFRCCLCLFVCLFCDLCLLFTCFVLLVCFDLFVDLSF